MSKKSISRETAEKQEGLEQIKNEVPDNRIQDTQQVAEVADAMKTKTTETGFGLKKTQGKGSELKQQKISEAITGSGVNTGMGISPAGRSVSGTIGGVLGANNSTPQAGKARSDSRTGKKLDRIATKLNYTPCEQVLLPVDESKPLADASTEDQGFNGTYRNEYARSQKIMGAVPADLLYQRSVDLIAKDKLYHVEGQMVHQTGDNPLANTPTTTLVKNEVTGEYVQKDVEYHLGNFIHKAFNFGLTAAGKVRYFFADVDDISANNINVEDANMSSAHKLIKQNVAELDRMTMDAKAGDEKADIWTPLARAINEPTRASFLMSSIEALTGAYVFLAYSKASTNMAYQLNRGPKDGLDEITPAIEQCVGWRSSLGESSDIKSAVGGKIDKTYIFNANAYRLGDPTIMIDAYDSIAKYHNKADFLLQPRGYRMHLQTADNNMNPLKVPSEFANVYAGTEVFSTIEHEYEPLLPICMTDKANLISPLNLNELCAFWNEAGYRDIDIEFVSDTTASYDSEDVKVAERLVASKMNWPKLYVIYKMVTTAGYSTDAKPVYDATNHVITLDTDRTNDAKTAFNLVVTPTLTGYTGYTTLVTINDPTTQTYDIIFKKPVVSAGKVTAINKYVALGNNWTYYKGGEYAYAYSDLRNNYIVTVRHPLVHGLIEYLNNSIGAKFYSLLNLSQELQENDPRTFQDQFTLPLIFSTQYMTLAQLFICAATPWIARVRENSMKDVIYYEDNVKEYPYSKLTSIKNVPFKNYVNFGYTDYDSPLDCRVMNPVQAIRWTMPEFFWKIDIENYVLPWYYNENDLNSDGSVKNDAANMSMPSIRSGIRLGLLDNLYGMTEKDIRLSLDRMNKHLLRDADISNFRVYKYGRTTDGQPLAILGSGKLFTVGKILSCPRELGLEMDAPLGVLTIDPADYLGLGGITDLKPLSADGTATSYRIKVWTNVKTPEHPDILSSGGVNIDRASNYVQKWYEICANNATSNCDVTGLVFGMGDDANEYSPFAYIGSGASAETGLTVRSYQRSLNTRLQFLPFVISPFDGNHVGTYTHDIYDIAYMFGLCGFRASDYRESVYNREKRVVNEGMLFVSDPWIEDSPIIKGAAKATGVMLSNGYEVK